MRFFLSLFLFLAVWACNPNTSQDDQKSGFSDNYSNTNREIWQKPELVLDLFGDISTKTIADIGAGNGFFTFRLAETAEHVIGVEITLDMIKELERRTPDELQAKVDFRLAQASNPDLSEDEVDAILIVNTYMYLNNRVQYLKNLKAALKPNGRILISDFKKKQTQVGPATDDRVPLYQVERDLQDAGFFIVLADDTSLEYQYLILAACRTGC